jgi:hypothetical protein
MSRLVPIITARDAATRDLSLDEALRGLSTGELLQECDALEEFRHRTDNLYERVRALLFLHAIHRFHLAARLELAAAVHVPADANRFLLDRRFEEAIARLRGEQGARGCDGALASAFAAAYKGLGFQTLADQVRKSVRHVRGNQWMFRCGHPLDLPLAIRPELARRGAAGYPLLRERTPVRMDLSHSGWSDIFFLGMDHPEGAKVLNVSIDLSVRGRGSAPVPPIETWLRVIDEPLLRLTSVDLGATADVGELPVLFDFARDHLGLLKAALLASGIVPPGLEGSGAPLRDLLDPLVGAGRGLEVVSRVRDIPKGSRLAVSTSLLASLISLCMRATGQTKSLVGVLDDGERRTCAARAILGEWLGGSGGGWQDSGGLWPGIKLIEGVAAGEGDPEFGTSRGRLLPKHTLLKDAAAPETTRRALMESLVLVHGGMAQNVGPILEMVTEKYLLRGAAEWKARHETLAILDELLQALKSGDVAALARATTRNFFGPIQTIIPWASNAFTESVIERTRARFGSDFLGFWMLGGMSGGGMGFIFTRERQPAAKDALLSILKETRRDFEPALPFAMEPVVYDFAINDRGTFAELLEGDDALLPADYYTQALPELLRKDPRSLTPLRRAELDRFAQACRARPELSHVVPELFDRLLPKPVRGREEEASLAQLLEENGFDRELHEQVRRDLLAGRVGLAQNRLPASTVLEDVRPGDVVDARRGVDAEIVRLGERALARGEVAVVTLAAGAASRWTGGAGVVKVLSPVLKLDGAFRTFFDLHVAKSRKAARAAGRPLAHVFTTSYVTQRPLEARLRRERESRPGPGSPDVELLLSPGRSVGLRLVPTVRDLKFAWEETRHQRLDVQQQKVRESLHAALIDWARSAGEASDYVDNLPSQCLHPVGHWYELPNLLRNGVLRDLLARRPELKTLLLHNVDTLGASVDAGLLGLHLREVERGAALTFEVIARQLDDRGGGLARVHGRPRLVEGLALPRDDDELGLTFYNTMTTWIDVDRLLATFGLTRADLADARGGAAKVAAGVRRVAAQLPTCITLKEVKKRWGHGQEDVFPVTQFEKLWSDMTALPDVASRFVVVPRRRGQQLKDPAQLDGWLRDGSAGFVTTLCAW